jgi:ribosome recycling factor
MVTEAIIATAQEQMAQSLSHLQQELGKVRTGRASLGLLEDVRVESYGQSLPLVHVATLNIPEPRLITIQPWDAAVIPDIERALQKAQLGLSPANDGKIIRLPIPPLTEERRKDIVKVVCRLGEEAKVSVRNARRDANDQIKQGEKEGNLTEDDVKRMQHDVQKITDGFVAKVDDTVRHKEDEVMTV